MIDPYLYPNSSVLKNKANIKDEEKLKEYEKMISFIGLMKVDELLKSKKAVDFDYLKSIHKCLFEEVYEWAGNIRELNIYKDERVLKGASVDYEKFNNIEVALKKLLEEMDSKKWTKMDLETQTKQFSYFVTKLWQVHPFREGNTRTMITFAAHYAISHGFSFDRELFSNNSQYARDALTIATVGKEYDSYIRNIMKDAIKAGDRTYFKKELLSFGIEPIDKLVDNLLKINNIFERNVSIKEIKHLYLNQDKLSEEEKDIIIEAGRDFIQQEKKQLEKSNSKQNNFEIEL